MTKPTSDVSQILKENGYSLTQPRLIVFDLLLDQEPLSLVELHNRAAGKLDRASLYRIIALFEQIGIVQRVNIGWKYKIELSDKFAEHHHHLTCIKCHKIIPINEQELEEFVSNLAAYNHFKPIEHQVEIQGYCETCQGDGSNR
jgi:Fur family ferric uptake transcriptional regulator